MSLCLRIGVHTLIVSQHSEKESGLYGNFREGLYSKRRTRLIYLFNFHELYEIGNRDQGEMVEITYTKIVIQLYKRILVLM